MTTYWSSSATYHVYLIRADERPAGFCLVQSSPVAPEGRDR